MNIADIIAADRAGLVTDVHSAKRALQTIATLLAHGTPYLTAGEIFSALIARERLGSTGIGTGVAIPHARMKGLDECVGAIIRLSDTIDFGADDGQPVDLLFGLLVPDQSDQEYSGILQAITAVLDDNDCCTELRHADDGKALVNLLMQYDCAPQARKMKKQG